MTDHPDPGTDPVPQDPSTPPGITRKTLLKAAVATGFAAPMVLAGSAFAKDSTSTGPASTSGTPGTPYAVGPAGPRPITPACHDGDAPTIDQTEGPYFEPGSPQTTVLATSSTPGTPLTVTGVVYGLSCLPISGALLDFWQADDGGNYDMTGYNLRGHQYTDAQGNFTLTTIVPGLYPGRTKHIHVKVQAPNQPILTTQLYFPGVPENSTDTIFDARLLMDVTQNGSGEAAAFDFILNVAQGGGPPPPPPTGTWVPDHAYNAGDVVTYNGTTYVCLQAHTSQVGWEPPNTPSLWQAQ